MKYFRRCGRRHLGQVLHRSALTTSAARRAIQKADGLQVEERTSAADVPIGPRERSTVLSQDDEASSVPPPAHPTLDRLYALRYGFSLPDCRPYKSTGS